MLKISGQSDLQKRLQMSSVRRGGDGTEGNYIGRSGLQFRAFRAWSPINLNTFLVFCLTIYTFLSSPLDPDFNMRIRIQAIFVDPDPTWIQWIELEILTNLLFWSLNIHPSIQKLHALKVGVFWGWLISFWPIIAPGPKCWQSYTMLWHICF